MRFYTDKQSIDDLQIFGNAPGKSVFELFDHTFTRGGAAILDSMFRAPLADAAEINQRSLIFKGFSGKKWFPFDTELFDIADQYLANSDRRTLLDQVENSMKRRLNNLIAEDLDYKFVFTGVSAVVEILFKLKDYVQELKNERLDVFCTELSNVEVLLSGLESELWGKSNVVSNLSYEQIAKLDVFLRFNNAETISRLFGFIYQLDVYISVGKIAVQHGFTYATALSGDQNILELENVYHPLLKNAVPNTFLTSSECNVTFLTGANMAGKSTFMKSLGISVYLAHMGFPIAADKMVFSVLDGMYTTINLPDNLGAGTSHFYAEVLRVKKVARELSQSKRLFVLIDELFRGTNVKDAYEATIAITEAFATKRNAMFIISTHIIEAGMVLKERCENIQFTYLPTRIENNMPIYTYQIRQGITADRHGMLIIQNEGILEILKNGNKSHSV